MMPLSTLHHLRKQRFVPPQPNVRLSNFTVNRLATQIVFTNNRPGGFQTNCTGTNSNLYTSIKVCEIKVMGKITKKNIDTFKGN